MFTPSRRLWAAPAALILGLAAAVVPLSPAFAASLTVTTTADTIDAAANCAGVTIASLPGPGGLISLREAICAANSNSGADTISFAINGTFALSGAANEDNGSTGDFDVKDSLTINGFGQNNTIIDGAGIERIFDVFPASTSTFTLSNLTVQNGDTRSTSFTEGGAMYLHNNVITTLTDVTVRNNYAGANGAIENRGTLAMTRVTVSGNSTIPASGNVVGGGLHNAGTMTITNSTFSGNLVRGEGGAIATSTGAGTSVTITGSTFSGNSAQAVGGGNGHGGAISTTGNQGTITITNSTFSGNVAATNGGGLYLSTPGGGTGAVTLTHVTIASNSASYGGGIAVNVAAVTLRNALIAQNAAGGGPDLYGAVTASGSLLGDPSASSGVEGVGTNQTGVIASPLDPKLGPLASNGGSTQTRALLYSSPAIDSADSGFCPSADQVGTSRPQGIACDIGAYELVPDSTPPDTTITANPTNPSASSSATFSFTGSDSESGVASYTCQIDGGGYSTCASPRNYSALADGSHTFQVRAADAANNVDPTPASYTWVVDTTAPNTFITAGPNDPTSSASSSFSFGAIDTGSGLASYECSLDGSTYAACTDPYTTGALADGSHQLSVSAIDNAGNQDQTPAVYTWTIATMSASITSSPPSSTTSRSATFAFTGTGAVDHFECSLDAASFTVCTSPTTVSGLAVGNHTFRVRAVDRHGGTSSAAVATWSVTGAGDLALTGAQPQVPAGLAVFLLVAGAGLTIIPRLRRPRAAD